MRFVSRWSSACLAGLVLGGASPGQTVWQDVSPAVSPPPRMAHAMAYDPVRDEVVLFGGLGAPRELQDTWVWKAGVWQLRTPGASPSPRYGHGMAFDPVAGKVLLFGGRDLISRYFSDTWHWDGSNWAPVGGTPPPLGRAYFGIATDTRRSRIVLHGGASYPQGVPVGDTWEWDGSAWISINPTVAPAPRMAHSLVYDRRVGRTILLGGASGLWSEMWEYNGLAWTLMPTSGGVVFGAATYDVSRSRIIKVQASGTTFVRTYEFDSSAWEERGKFVGPPDRTEGAMTYVSSLNSAILFGGGDVLNPALRLGDTWLYRHANPASATPFGSGCAVPQGVPTLTTAPGELPWIDDDLVIRLTGPLTTAGPSFLLLGFSNTTWTGGSLPVDLGTIGMPTCSLLVSTELTFMMLPQHGAPTLTVPICKCPLLDGHSFYAQGFTLSVGANQLGVVVSNGNHATLRLK